MPSTGGNLQQGQLPCVKDGLFLASRKEEAVLTSSMRVFVVLAEAYSSQDSERGIVAAGMVRVDGCDA